MKLEELNNVRNLNVDTIDEFKRIVQEAVESNYCHNKQFGSWLFEEYCNLSKDDYKEYKAIIIIMNDCYQNQLNKVHFNNKIIDSVSVYSVFYTNRSVGGGGFITHKINLHYNAIKSLNLLTFNKNEGDLNYG